MTINQYLARVVQEALDRLRPPAQEPIDFAAYLPPEDDQTPWAPTVPNVLHEEPPPIDCKVIPGCERFQMQREIVELEDIIDNAYQLAYAQAWRDYPHKPWNQA